MTAVMTATIVVSSAAKKGATHRHNESLIAVTTHLASPKPHTYLPLQA